MTSGATAPLRLVTFGDLEGNVWGAAIDAGEPAIVFGAATASEAAAGTANIHFLDDGDRWSLPVRALTWWCPRAVDRTRGRCR